MRTNRLFLALGVGLSLLLVACGGQTGNTGGGVSGPGSTWTLRNSGTTQHLFGVTYGGNKFVAVGGSGTEGIVVTWDGESPNWSTPTQVANKPLYGVTYGNGTFVAVGEDGTILTSPDGVNWTPRESGTTQPLYGVTYGNGTFVAVGKNGTILTSP